MEFLSRPRSVLFVPGDRSDLIAKAISSDADAVCIDLEDGVAAKAKERARASLFESIVSLKKAKGVVYIRLNSVGDKEAFHDDLAALDQSPDGIILSKAESWQQVHDVDIRLQEKGLSDKSLSIIAMIEDPASLRSFENSPVISSRISGLLLGTEDFASVCRCEPHSPLIETAYYRMVLLARGAGLGAYGMPGGIGDFRNLTPFIRAASIARNCGGDGAFAIHPKQIDVLKEIFSPTREEMQWADDVIALFEAGAETETGVVSLDGCMIDLPVYNRARQIRSE